MTTMAMKRVIYLLLAIGAATTIHFASGFTTPSSPKILGSVARCGGGGCVRHRNSIMTTTTTTMRAVGGGGSFDGSNNNDGDSGSGNNNNNSSSCNTNKIIEENEARQMVQKAQQYRNEAEKLRLSLGIRRIDELEKDIRSFLARGEGSGGDDNRTTLRELKARAEELIRRSLGSGTSSEEAEELLSSLSTSSSSIASSLGGSSTTSSSSSRPTRGNSFSLTDEEMQAAIAFMDGLTSGPLKDALSSLAGSSSSSGWQNDLSLDSKEEYIKNLYQWKDVVTIEGLRDLYMEGIAGNVDNEKDAYKKTAKLTDREEAYELSNMSKILASKIEEQIENSTRAMELFPRSLQDAEEDTLPTEADANTVFQLLGKNFMATEKPMPVNGGYIIRGVNKRKSAKELLDVLDAKLLAAKTTSSADDINDRSQPWTDRYQVSFVEIYSDTNDELFEDALLITPNYFTPLAPKLLSGITSLIALFSSFVYCINTFGGNTVVMQRLKEASESATAGGMGMGELTWFNDLLIPLLVTLGAAQGVHEIAHSFVAWSKEVRYSVLHLEVHVFHSHSSYIFCISSVVR